MSCHLADSEPQITFQLKQLRQVWRFSASSLILVHQPVILLVRMARQNISYTWSNFGYALQLAVFLSFLRDFKGKMCNRNMTSDWTVTMLYVQRREVGHYLVILWLSYDGSQNWIESHSLFGCLKVVLCYAGLVRGDTRCGIKGFWFQSQAAFVSVYNHGKSIKISGDLQHILTS